MARHPVGGSMGEPPGPLANLHPRYLGSSKPVHRNITQLAKQVERHRPIIPAACLRTEPGETPAPSANSPRNLPRAGGAIIARAHIRFAEHTVQHSFRLRPGATHRAERAHALALRNPDPDPHRQLPGATATVTRATTHRFCSNIWVHQEPDDPHDNIEEHKLPNLP